MKSIRIKQVSYWLLLFCLSGLHPLWGQSINDSFSFDGLQRDYTLYLPTNYQAGQAYPLVFNLHGYGSNASQQASMTEFNQIADTADFIVVYPEGTQNASLKQYWNAAYGTTIDDVGFINALLDTMIANYNIQQNRVYSTGISNGAMMSSTLACELDDRFAAIAGVAGTMSLTQYNNCPATDKMPVMLIHGTSDLVVPYAGSGLLVGVTTLVDFWRMHNGLPNSPTTTAFPNTSLLDGSTADWIQYGIGLPEMVELIRVNNGGHSWPGSGVIISGTTNMDVHASTEIWRFFNSYSKATNIAKLSNTNIGAVLHGPLSAGVYELNLEGSELTQMQLLTANGQVLWTRRSQDQSLQISLAQYPAGLYFLACHNKNGQQHFKLIK